MFGCDGRLLSIPPTFDRLPPAEIHAPGGVDRAIRVARLSGQVNRFLRPHLAEFSVPKRVMWGVAAGAMGALLLWVIPVPPAPVRSAHSLKIVATGKKSAASHSTEVWVYGLFAPNGRCIVPASAFSREGEWVVRDDALVSYRGQPTVLTWEGQEVRALQLRLLSHSWSGIAKVTWNGGEQELDLYSASGAPKTVTPLVAPPDRTLANELLFRVSEAITLGACFLWLALYFVARPNAVAGRACGRWTWLACAPAVAQSRGADYLWVFWPGLMSPDSYDQWRQAASLWGIGDGHPAFHTMTLWLVGRLWYSPAAVAIAQILALSTVVGWGLAKFRRRGMSAWLAWFICGFSRSCLPTGRWPSRYGRTFRTVLRCCGCRC